MFFYERKYALFNHKLHTTTHNGDQKRTDWMNDWVKGKMKNELLKRASEMQDFMRCHAIRWKETTICFAEMTVLSDFVWPHVTFDFIIVFYKYYCIINKIKNLDYLITTHLHTSAIGRVQKGIVTLLFLWVMCEGEVNPEPR